MKSRGVIITMFLGAAFAILPVAWPVHQALAQFCVTPPSGLISSWPGDGQANDIAGSNNGVSKNGATFAAGKVGGAFSFDGVDDYVDLGSQPDLNVAAGAGFAIEGWIRTTENFGAILSMRSQANGAPVIDIMIGDIGVQDSLPGKLLALVRDNEAQVSTPNWALVNGGSVDDGSWHHFALVRSAGTGTIELFLDGVSQGTSSSAESDGAITTDLRALGSERRWDQDGYSSPDHRFLNGFIDEVAIYNRALSVAEIQAIFNAGSAGKCKVSGTVALTGCTACQQGNVFVAHVSASNHLVRWLEAKIGAYLPDGTPVNLMSSKHLELPPGFSFDGEVFRLTLPSGLPQGSYQFCVRFLELEMGEPLALSCQPFTIGP